VGIFLAGIYSWNQLRQELIPDIELPFVTVITALPGAGAEDVSAQVTEPIERAIENVPGLETVQSSSGNSISLVFAQFDFGTDLKETLAEVETAVEQAALPEGAAPQVSSFDFNAAPIIIATLSPVEGADPVEAAAITREEVVPALLAIDGVASAELTGGETPILDIVLDPEKMAESGIALQQVQGILLANQITLPSGAIDEGNLRLPVSTEHRFSSVAELESQIVGARTPAAGLPDGASEAPAGDQPSADETTDDETGGGLGLPDLGSLTEALAAIPVPVTLGDVATIEQRNVNLSGYARTNGQPSLTVSITKRSGGNTVTVADEVLAVFEQTEEAHGDLVSVEVIQDQSTFIRESTQGLVQEGLLGALFAILVIYIFLRTHDARRRHQHPALDPGCHRRLRRGRADHQHPHPGRSRRGRRTSRGRLDRGAREHLPASGPG
jgi:HAE1 family hydrophobic/amphiphilic exporter-1